MPLAVPIFAALFLAGAAGALPAAAAVREYELTIAAERVVIGGRSAAGMTLNGAIPGPTLRFTEGETARIRVHNRLSVETSIHWHGVLVPPQMDGVPYLSFPPIAPGATFTYEFELRQSGTYWYHSHTMLQEQSGVYGALVIEPRETGAPPTRDAVVVLSDWTLEDPHAVNRTLRRGSDWYAIEKGAGQSLIGAARLGRLGDFFARELQRMAPMDIADVAYDFFLANGQPETAIAAAPGETMRVRVVDGSATTYFHLEFAGGPLTIVAADGQDVEPFEERRLLIGVAETYDLLVRVPAGGAYELRATAHDGSGYASVWIGEGKRHAAPRVPRPNLYHAMGGLSLGRILALTPAGAMGMSDGDVAAGRFDRPGMEHGADHGTPQEPPHDPEGTTDPEAAAAEFFEEAPAPAASPGGRRFGKNHGLLATDVAATRHLAGEGTPERPGTPYPRLRSAAPTAFAPGRAVREIRLTLDGDMERYVWFLNNQTLAESEAILIREGEIVRLILVNRTMMHHPMHLHGHFFRVINGQGDRAPLKHTVDVAPMSTTVIEFAAGEPGDWFFHCHLLYHMENGMARVVHYEGFDAPPALAALRPRLHPEAWQAWGQIALLSSMTEGAFVLSGTRTALTASWEAGWGGISGTAGEALVAASRHLNAFWSFFAGAAFEGGSEDAEETRGVFGVDTLLPLRLELRAWVDSDGGARARLEKSLPLTPRLILAGSVDYDTRERWEGQAGLSYTLSQEISLLARWHSRYGAGAGLQLRF